MKEDNRSATNFRMWRTYFIEALAYCTAGIATAVLLLDLYFGWYIAIENFGYVVSCWSETKYWVIGAFTAGSPTVVSIFYLIFAWRLFREKCYRRIISSGIAMVVVGCTLFYFIFPFGI